MHHTIRSLISLSLLLILGSLTLQGQERCQLPNFQFTDLEGVAFTPASIDPTLPTMVMLFDPYCDHCDTQANWIAEAADSFANRNVIFVTIEPETAPVKDFAQRHFADKGLKHVYVLQDLDFMFESYFGYTDDAVNIYLYTPGKKQPKYFGAEQEVAVLLKYL